MNSAKYALLWDLNCLVFREFTAKLLLLKVKVRNYLIQLMSDWNELVSQMSDIG